MLVKEANKEKINAVIKNAEGRAKVRTITYDDIVEDIEKLERHLGIAKKAMVGIKASVDHHSQKFPSAYKYRPESTQYYIIRKSGGWDLSEVCRDWVRQRNDGMFSLTLTEDAEKAILDSMRWF